MILGLYISILLLYLPPRIGSTWHGSGGDSVWRIWRWQQWQSSFPSEQNGFRTLHISMLLLYLSPSFGSIWHMVWEAVLRWQRWQPSFYLNRMILGLYIHVSPVTLIPSTKNWFNLTDVPRDDFKMAAMTTIFLSKQNDFRTLYTCISCYSYTFHQGLVQSDMFRETILRWQQWQQSLLSVKRKILGL